jgi:hypothetical protein
LQDVSVTLQLVPALQLGLVTFRVYFKIIAIFLKQLFKFYWAKKGGVALEAARNKLL